MRYILKMMKNLMSLKKLEKIRYTLKAKGCLVHLKGVIGNNGHMLRRSRDLHHLESGARLESSRRVTFVDGDDFHDR